jgi:(2R)-3-sulfolactate dehydrogenase (NADP+)
MKLSSAVELGTKLLHATGVPIENAELTSRLICAADAWGIGSHGLIRLPYYLQRLSKGGINPTAQLVAEKAMTTLSIMNGQDGLGHWQLWQATTAAAKAAQEHGSAAIAVKSSSHAGALGLFTWPSIEKDCLTFVFSNGPAVMPAWGGSKPLLSTSPLAIGVPGKPTQLIIDLATSAVARGKIAAKAKAGEPVPVGWALDKDGNPTTDAQAALMGMLAPLGGAKGFALAMAVETLTGGLVGPNLASGMPDMFNPADDSTAQRISHFVISVNAAFIDDTEYARISKLQSSVIDSGSRIPGANKSHPMQLSGDLELNIAPEVVTELDQWSSKLIS